MRLPGRRRRQRAGQQLGRHRVHRRQVDQRLAEGRRLGGRRRLVAQALHDLLRRQLGSRVRRLAAGRSASVCTAIRSSSTGCCSASRQRRSAPCRRAAAAAGPAAARAGAGGSCGWSRQAQAPQQLVDGAQVARASCSAFSPWRSIASAMHLGPGAGDEAAHRRAGADRHHLLGQALRRCRARARSRRSSRVSVSTAGLRRAPAARAAARPRKARAATGCAGRAARPASARARPVVDQRLAVGEQRRPARIGGLRCRSRRRRRCGSSAATPDGRAVPSMPGSTSATRSADTCSRAITRAKGGAAGACRPASPRTAATAAR